MSPRLQCRGRPQWVYFLFGGSPSPPLRHSFRVATASTRQRSLLSTGEGRGLAFKAGVVRSDDRDHGVVVVALHDLLPVAALDNEPRPWPVLVIPFVLRHWQEGGVLGVDAGLSEVGEGRRAWSSAVRPGLEHTGSRRRGRAGDSFRRRRPWRPSSPRTPPSPSLQTPWRWSSSKPPWRSASSSPRSWKESFFSQRPRGILPLLSRGRRGRRPRRIVPRRSPLACGFRAAADETPSVVPFSSGRRGRNLLLLLLLPVRDERANRQRTGRDGRRGGEIPCRAVGR